MIITKSLNMKDNIYKKYPLLLGWHSLIRSVTENNGQCSNQTDRTTQEESESRSTSGKS